MNEKLLPAARIAELVGVSRQAITKHFADSYPEAKTGTKWNVYHPGIFDYLSKRGVDIVNTQVKSAAKRRDKQAVKPVSQSRDVHSRNRESNNIPVGDVPDISDYPEMSLRDIAQYHGTEDQFRSWADAYKKVQEGIEREIRNKKLKGDVIDREYVEKYVLGLVEELTSRMLVDSPSNLVSRIYAHKDAGDSKEEAEETARRELSKLIKSAKGQIVKRIESA